MKWPKSTQSLQKVPCVFMMFSSFLQIYTKERNSVESFSAAVKRLRYRVQVLLHVYLMSMSLLLGSVGARSAHGEFTNNCCRSTIISSTTFVDYCRTWSTCFHKWLMKDLFERTHAWSAFYLQSHHRVFAAAHKDAWSTVNYFCCGLQTCTDMLLGGRWIWRSKPSFPC